MPRANRRITTCGNIGCPRQVLYHNTVYCSAECRTAARQASIMVKCRNYDCPVMLTKQSGQIYCSTACGIAYRRMQDKADRDIARHLKAEPAVQALLPPGAEPRALVAPLVVERVDLHRRFDCAKYDGCLNAVSEGLWQSFSCRGCPGFEAKPEEGPRLALVRW